MHTASFYYTTSAFFHTAGRCDVLAESSTRRGAGLTVKARCPLHVNVTAALLDTLSDMQQQMTRLFVELDADNFRRRVEVVRAAQTAPGADGEAKKGPGAGGVAGTEGGASGREDDEISRYRHREVVQYDDVLCIAWPADEAAREPGPGGGRENSGGEGGGGGGGGDGGGGLGKLGVGNVVRFPVCHEFSAPLPLEARMSFTILNLTGQRTRYFQPRAGEETRRLQYLRVRNAEYNTS